MSECLEVEHRAARAWLDRVRRASAAIEGAVRELAALKDAKAKTLVWRTSGAGTATGAGTHSDPTASEAERRMGELDVLIVEAERRLVLLQDQVGECGTMLDCMGEELGRRHAKAIELYYIDLAPTWSEVAEEMECSYRWLCKLRENAYAWIETNFREALV